MRARVRLGAAGGGVIVGALLALTSLAAYATDIVTHPGSLLTWYDLNVYNDAGLIARELPGYLYQWQLSPGIRFTYPPIAAILFEGGSALPYPLLRWLLTCCSVLALPLTAWLVLGAMGGRGGRRLTAALIVGALALWTEPVWHALFFGQIEPLLMLLVVFDLTRPDGRRWQGAGIGVAAGIKLIPLIFIPYLLLTGKVRQAAVATGVFVSTVAAGFALLPGPSRQWWLTGYFLQPGKTGAVDALVNQALLGMFARAAGPSGATEAVWLPVAVAVLAIGMLAGAALSRAGDQVAGWNLVALTGLLVSPISWDHHWVWIVSFLALLAGLVLSARRVRRWALVALGIAALVIFGAWPASYTGARAFVPSQGLLGGWSITGLQTWQVARTGAWSVVTWNLFVIAGSAAYLGLVLAAGLTWRSRRRARRALPASPGPARVAAVPEVAAPGVPALSRSAEPEADRVTGR